MATRIRFFIVYCVIFPLLIRLLEFGTGRECFGNTNCRRRNEPAPLYGRWRWGRRGTGAGCGGGSDASVGTEYHCCSSMVTGPRRVGGGQAGAERMSAQRWREREIERDKMNRTPGPATPGQAGSFSGDELSTCCYQRFLSVIMVSKMRRVRIQYCT